MRASNEHSGATGYPGPSHSAANVAKWVALGVVVGVATAWLGFALFQGRSAEPVAAKPSGSPSSIHVLKTGWMVTGAPRLPGQRCFVGRRGNVTVKDDKGNVVAEASRPIGGRYGMGGCLVGGGADPRGALYLKVPDRPFYTVTTGGGCSTTLTRDRVMKLEEEDHYFDPCLKAYRSPSSN